MCCILILKESGVGGGLVPFLSSRCFSVNVVLKIYRKISTLRGRGHGKRFNFITALKDFSVDVGVRNISKNLLKSSFQRHFLRF